MHRQRYDYYYEKQTKRLIISQQASITIGKHGLDVLCHEGGHIEEVLALLTNPVHLDI
jgi:hypothetical protein